MESSDIEVIFPDYLEGYEFETESKGYMTGLQVREGSRIEEYIVYDKERMAQEVADAIDADGYFLAEARVLIVASVTKECIEEAVRSMYRVS